MKIVIAFEETEGKGIQNIVETVEKLDIANRKSTNIDRGGNNNTEETKGRDRVGDGPSANNPLNTCVSSIVVRRNQTNGGVDVEINVIPAFVVDALDIVRDHAQTIKLLYSHGKKLFKSYVDFVIESVGVFGSMKERFDKAISKYKE